ncbi:hypothetical protein BJX63DRAFT_109952 [Aspergillus granulosus]|uniref:Uncharacterized protein n=1 Tax=Aspergillus granulosus TaxID=176169 RepID=A0ABR4HPN5_9EURO
MIEGVQVPIQLNEAGAGRKVSFQIQELTADGDDLQVPDSQMNGARPRLVVLSPNRNYSMRTNRWTYSKRQR